MLDAQRLITETQFVRTLRLPLLLPLLAAGLWFAAGRICTAQEVKFPEKAPLVSITFPDGWIVDEESNTGFTSLDCISSATVKFHIRLLKDTYSDADFKQKMPGFIKANLGSFGLDASSLDPGAVKTTSRLLGKIQAVCYEVKLKSLVLDEPYQLRCAGFTVDGKAVLVIWGMEDSAQKAGLDFDKILGSLKPVK